MIRSKNMNTEKNIRFLFENKGLTQEESAKILGETYTKEQINQWLNTRGFPEDIIKKIANYFEISIETIKNADLEDFFVYSEREIDEIHQKLFPYKEKTNTEKNSFSKAFELHQKILNDEIEPKEFYDLCIRCYRLYYQSYKKGDAQALINMLSISCYYKYIAKNFDTEIEFTNEELARIDIEQLENIKDGRDLVNLNLNTKRKILKKFLTCNNAEKKEKIDKFIIERSNEIMILIKRIRNIPEYRDIYEYYIAIITLLNLIDNGYNKYENAHFGEMYLDLLFQVGNKYAVQLAETIPKSNLEN
jgi:transcriptional regulator with XRE-family HTH domain